MKGAHWPKRRAGGQGGRNLRSSQRWIAQRSSALGERCEKHRLPIEQCAPCYRESLRPVEFSPIAFSSQSQARAIAFSSKSNSEYRCLDFTEFASVVMRSNSESYPIPWCEVSTDRLCMWVAAIARSSGLVFPGISGYGKVGKSTKCWNCGASLDAGRPGCWHCRYRVCNCGNCLCDFRGGWVYPGKNIPPKTTLRYELAIRSLLTTTLCRIATELSTRPDHLSAIHRACPWWPQTSEVF